MQLRPSWNSIGLCHCALNYHPIYEIIIIYLLSFFSPFMLFNSFHFVMFCFEMKFLYFVPGFKRWSCCSFLGASITDVPYIPSATIAGCTLLIYFLLLVFFFLFVFFFFLRLFILKSVCCVGTGMCGYMDACRSQKRALDPWSCSDTWL